MWADQRGGLPDIYAQQLNFLTGTPQWTADGTRRVRRFARAVPAHALAPFKPATPCRLFTTWTDNRAGTERYVFQQRLNCLGAGAVDGRRHDADAAFAWWPPTPTHTASGSSGTRRRTSRPRVSRRGRSGVDAVGDAVADGSGNLDVRRHRGRAGVPATATRLGVTQAGVQTFSDVTWVDVPVGLAFALEGFRPNPSAKEPVVAFTLARSGTARLDVIDLAGRRVVQRDLSSLDAGSHVVRLGHTLRPGVYMVALTQGGERRTARAVVSP